ncbi:MAG TPA: protein translocase subunit SecD [Candidatus Paceibacterota bacterium]
MRNVRAFAVLILLVGVALGYFVYSTQTGTSGWAFKLGLDLRGGSQLVYKANVSKIPSSDVNDSTDALRDVIERRVNLFGVVEPNVQIETVNIGVAGSEKHLLVELPGVTNIDDAITLIGQTPVLEFKTERPIEERDKILKQIEELKKKQKAGKDISQELSKLQDPYYVDTQLTGRYLSKATVEFSSQTGQPYVSLVFNDEGAKLFTEITKANIGKTVAVYLDAQPISTPVVQAEITGGKAQITGGFTPQEAKLLAGRMNSGALPVPIELIATNKIGATLGEGALDKGVRAALYGYILVALFLIAWYRLPGLIAALALLVYGVIVLSIFKLFGVTLTAAGIAGFILSLGMAVDANVLIFERIKEEKKKGKTPVAVLDEGFSRAWTSIRDSNISSLITAGILFWFGTSLIQGFALVWAIGILVSMFSALVVTKQFMKSVYLK